MDNPVIAVKSRDMYFFKHLPEQLVIGSINSKISPFAKLMKKINSFFLKITNYSKNIISIYYTKRILSFIYSKEVIRSIDENKPIVFFDSAIGADLAFYAKSVKATNYYVYFWNRVGKIGKTIIKIVGSQKCLSYSKIDSDFYGLTFVDDFYYAFPHDCSRNTNLDFYFLGRDKGRKGILLPFQEKMNKLGFISNIDVFSNHHSKKRIQGLHYCRSYVSYDNYLNKALSSKCLVEFENNNQTITLRTLESLFYGKKLITNNVEIKKLPFFSENNILVFTSLEELSKERVKSFLEKPIDKPSNESLTYYSFAGFIKKLELSTGLLFHYVP